MYLLDTNICIYAMKKRPVEVYEHLRRVNIKHIAVSSITLAELEYGAAKSRQSEQSRQSLFTFLTPLEILPFDDRAAEAYGHLRATLEATGQPIGPMDTLIAAHALSQGRILVTNNEREFARVEGLRVVNWAV